jgi:hypothetical protein
VIRPALLGVNHPAPEVATVPGLTDAEGLRPLLEASDVPISGVGAHKDGPVASSTTRAILGVANCRPKCVIICCFMIK